MEQEEERMWALQQEANRQLMVQNEMELQQKQRQMVSDLKKQHKTDKVETQVRWTNQYGELVPIP